MVEMMPEFDPDDVKIGNRKPETAGAYIELKRAEHLHRFISRAALSPLTGTVCAIGFIKHWLSLDDVDDEPRIILGNESGILTAFFSYFESMKFDTAWVGFNIAEFDIPFLMRRAWKLGITTPKFLRGRYLEDNVIDLAQLWRCGAATDYYVSLDTLSKFFGVGEKKVSGAEFHKLLATDPEEARRYLRNDLELTRDIAIKMGVI